jgi:hypothetical protein
VTEFLLEGNDPVLHKSIGPCLFSFQVSVTKLKISSPAPYKYVEFVEEKVFAVLDGVAVRCP